MDGYLLILFPLCLVSSLLLTRFIRYLSVIYDLIDHPNERSSHAVPVPKCGGIAIVIILLLIILGLIFYQLIDLYLALGLIVGMTIIAIIGFIDDNRGLSILIRAIFYIAGIITSLYIVNISHDLLFTNHYHFIMIMAIFWMVNLFNFMDGTDGFAAVQTICVAVFFGILFIRIEYHALGTILLCLACSTTGFLYWNWMPAKIFMGDVGSCTIGFVFGFLAFYTDINNMISLTIWFIVLSPFIGDATFTLLKRILKREKWYQAHNTHAYQLLYQSGMSHRDLALYLLIFNIFVIWPIASFAYYFHTIEIVMLILSYCLVASIWLFANRQNKIIKQ